MRLEKFLIDLLYQHDCVIVPGFGGLVANFRSARLNSSTHIIYPPSKHVGFNRHLVHNDGLLTSHISSALGISYKDAQVLIEEKVASFKKQLQSEGRVVWEKIGIFFKDTDGGLQFIPEDQENFLISSFGFSQIQLKPLEKENYIPSEIETPVVAITERKASGMVWKVAAAIAVPVGLGVLWMLSSTGGNGQFNLASLNPFEKEEIKAQYRMLAPQDRKVESGSSNTTGWQNALASMPEAERISFDFVQDKISDVGITVILKEESPKDNTDTKYSAPAVKDAVVKNKFELIGGAFAIEDNALHQLEELQSQGYNAYLAGKKGPLHLVAYGNYASYEEAKMALRELKSKGKSAWVKRRK